MARLVPIRQMPVYQTLITFGESKLFLKLLQKELESSKAAGKTPDQRLLDTYKRIKKEVDQYVRS